MSVALGAFFAGLVVGQSRFGPQAAADMAPFRDVFSALFFVSVGMLFDPAFVLREPLMVLAVLAIVLLRQAAGRAGHRARCCATRMRTAATVAVGLAQIGEFSFILGSLGVSLELLPRDGARRAGGGGHRLDRAQPAAVRLRSTGCSSGARAGARCRRRRDPDRPPAAAVVLAGHRALGRRVAALCRDAGVPLTVIDNEPDADAADAGMVYGDAGRPDVLLAAGIARRARAGRGRPAAGRQDARLLGRAAAQSAHRGGGRRGRRGRGRLAARVRRRHRARRASTSRARSWCVRCGRGCRRASVTPPARLLRCAVGVPVDARHPALEFRFVAPAHAQPSRLCFVGPLDALGQLHQLERRRADVERENAGERRVRRHAPTERVVVAVDRPFG